MPSHFIPSQPGTYLYCAEVDASSPDRRVDFYRYQVIGWEVSEPVDGDDDDVFAMAVTRGDQSHRRPHWSERYAVQFADGHLEDEFGVYASFDDWARHATRLLAAAVEHWTRHQPQPAGGGAEP